MRSVSKDQHLWPILRGSPLRGERLRSDGGEVKGTCPLIISTRRTGQIANNVVGFARALRAARRPGRVAAVILPGSAVAHDAKAGADTSTDI